MGDPSSHHAPPEPWTCPRHGMITIASSSTSGSSRDAPFQGPRTKAALTISCCFLVFAQHWAASLLLQLTHPEAIAAHHAQSILHADSVPNSLFATPCSYVLVPYSWLPSCPRWERGPCLTLSETRPSLHVPRSISHVSSALISPANLPAHIRLANGSDRILLIPVPVPFPRIALARASPRSGRC